MKKCLIIIFIISNNLFSQNNDVNSIIPNSPTTAKFEKVFSPHINEFKGTLDLSIPIYEIKVDNVVIPILLKYDSSGVKVDEEASWVGQSWSIMAGGMVTRNQVGIPDEMNKNSGFVPNVLSNSLNPLYGLPGQPKYLSSFCYTPQLYTGSGWFYSSQKIQNIVNLIESGTSPYSSDIYEEFVRGVDYGANDTSPDIFNIYLPNGRSEKFFFKNQSNISFFNKSKTKINYTNSTNDSGIKSFEILDNKGTYYQFSDIEYLRYHKNNFVTNSKNTVLTLDPDEVISEPIQKSTQSVKYSFSQAYAEALCVANASSEAIQIMDRIWPKAWHVSKVRSNKGREVLFEYETDTIYNLSKPEYNKSPYGGIGIKVQNNLQKIAYPRLTKISWDEGRIEFISSGSRLDVYSNSQLGIYSHKKALDKIIIYNANDKKIKEYQLNYIYINAIGYSNSFESHKKSIFKRLFLNEILIKDNSGQQVTSYTFNYNSTQLPNKFSPEVDYWGYYNNNDMNVIFPELWYYPDEQRDFIDLGLFSLYPRPSYSGNQSYDNQSYNSDRRPNSNYSKAGVLERVIYPTGGELHINYEQNRYLWRDTSVDGPGLRVSKTILKESSTDSIPIITDYKYVVDSATSGRIRTIPMFKGLARYDRISDPTPHYYSSSEPLNNFNFNFNNDFGYIKVEKKYSGGRNGKEVKTFTFPINLGDINFYHNAMKLYETTADKVTATIDYVNSYPGYTTNTTDYYPYPPETNFSFATGKLKSKKVYDKDTNLVLEEAYSYNYPPLVDATKSYFSSLGRFTSIRYLSAKHQLVNESTKEYFGSILKSQNKFFSYNNDFFISEIKTTNSEGKEVKENFKYPKEYQKERSEIHINPFYPYNSYTVTVKNTYSEMIEKNMLNFPIESTKSIDNKIVSSEINSFKKSGSRIVPDTYKNLEIVSPISDYSPVSVNSSGQLVFDNRIKNKIDYSKYDEKGNLLMYKLEDSQYSVIIWGYNKTYPIAKIENVQTYNSITNINQLQSASNNDNDRTIGNTGKEGELRNLLNNLRSSLPNSLVTTYTYDPLIGITSITDPRGETIYYQYDDFNRLKSVKDAKGNLLSKNEYKYKN